MKFSSQEDIEAPIEFVFQAATDFASFEKQALRRGAEVQRTDRLTELGPGMAWKATFPFRGKRRSADGKLVTCDAPNALAFVSDIGGMHGDLDIEFVALSQRRTRVSVELELIPNSLSARLLLQSLRLAKANLSRRFKKRIEHFAEDVEDRYNRTS